MTVAVVEQEWTRFQKIGKLPWQSTRVIQKAESGGRTFYRLRAPGFNDIAEARRFCSAVSEKAEFTPSSQNDIHPHNLSALIFGVEGRVYHFVAFLQIRNHLIIPRAER